MHWSYFYKGSFILLTRLLIASIDGQWEKTYNAETLIALDEYNDIVTFKLLRNIDTVIFWQLIFLSDTEVSDSWYCQYFPDN